jgi:hypothetical protein
MGREIHEAKRRSPHQVLVRWARREKFLLGCFILSASLVVWLTALWISDPPAFIHFFF